jgi:hypothetical protein
LHGDTKVSETELTGGGEAVVSLLENVGNVFSFEQANASRQEDSQPMSDSKAFVSGRCAMPDLLCRGFGRVWVRRRPLLGRQPLFG